MLKKMMMFAASLASRGITNNRVDEDVKRLRALSCFGGLDGIKPCPYLLTSRSSPNKNFCGKCGCGDKHGTWLLGEEGEYAKLDYPVLNCPVNMPGFTNYDPNFVNDEIRERKQAIENTDPEQLGLVQITIKKTN